MSLNCVGPLHAWFLKNKYYSTTQSVMQNKIYVGPTTNLYADILLHMGLAFPNRVVQESTVDDHLLIFL